MSNRIRSVLETFGVAEPTIVRAEWLLGEMNSTFQADVSDALIAGLVGEHEVMDSLGFRVREAMLDGVSQSERIVSRLQEYGNQYLSMVAGLCWCEQFHMSVFTELGHELLTALRVPELAGWLQRKLPDGG